MDLSTILRKTQWVCTVSRCGKHSASCSSEGSLQFWENLYQIIHGFELIAKVSLEMAQGSCSSLNGGQGTTHSMTYICISLIILRPLYHGHPSSWSFVCVREGRIVLIFDLLGPVGENSMLISFDHIKYSFLRHQHIHHYKMFWMQLPLAVPLSDDDTLGFCWV
jgi:hypothetical protein